jgi:hypothetical protein
MEKAALPFHKYLKNSIILEVIYETAHRRASTIYVRNRKYFSQANQAGFEEKL